MLQVQIPGATRTIQVIPPDNSRIAMSYTVCVVADTLRYPEGGGHMWVYLNWALGLKSIGCRVLWLEAVKSSIPKERLGYYVAELKSRLTVYNLQNSVALVLTFFVE